MDSTELRKEIIEAGYKAVKQLIKVANEKDNIKLESQGPNRTDTKQGFAERRSK